ncbi:dihydroorotase [Paraclostridium sordellii]|uniref:dihydroorotase n=1 Tax=Paraclostridium sordellii TaxID=1505 RepID=UPI0022E7912E|nr:dihydroorotase [Paeniclostridium sordellii]
MNKILIKNTRIVDANKDFKSDLLVEDGKISRIDTNIDSIDAKIINGENYILMPSFIDMHTHLRDPGLTHKEDLETGQRAALKGGFTVLCPMANTKPACDNKETMEYILDKAKTLDLCDINQVCAITKNLEGQEMIDIESMRKYTQLFSDDGYTLHDEDIMKDVLELSKELDFKVLTHCQPEEIIVKRDLKLLEKVGGNLHICHISLKETLEEIKKYKKNGYKFTCEVGPHHIYGYGLDYKVNPSFAKEEDMKYLIQGIKDGYIDMIGTDHAPHTEEDKKNGSPGISNIEVAFGMVNKVFSENGISLNKLSEMMSLNPAKLLGLNQGLIEEGLSADLVLINPDCDEVIDTEKFTSKGKNNPFDKQKIVGKVLMTIRNGKIMYDIKGDM